MGTLYFYLLFNTVTNFVITWEHYYFDHDVVGRLPTEQTEGVVL